MTGRAAGHIPCVDRYVPCSSRAPAPPVRRRLKSPTEEQRETLRRWHRPLSTSPSPSYPPLSTSPSPSYPPLSTSPSPSYSPLLTSSYPPLSTSPSLSYPLPSSSLPPSCPPLVPPPRRQPPSPSPFLLCRQPSWPLRPLSLPRRWV